MMFKHICLLLLAVVAFVAAQAEDELIIPVENDNQFPPDNNFEPEVAVGIEGSGFGAEDEPAPPDQSLIVPVIEDVQQPVSEDNTPIVPTSEDTSCPKPCVCRIEGDSNSFIVDCSGYELTELPTPIDVKATDLLIQNNKLTEIPKEISSLKNLKVLNAENNSIMDLALGSVSELPELTVLKLGKNRLIEYPRDLKNGFGLIKLEELDLGKNDMRMVLEPDTFSGFTALKKLTLPTSTPELNEKLCTSLKDHLEVVCTETCDTQLFECPNAPHAVEEDLLNIILPGTLAFASDFDTNDADSPDDTDTTDANLEIQKSSTSPPETGKDVIPSNEFSLRTAVSKADGISPLSTLVQMAEAPKNVAGEHEKVDEQQKPDVAVGATTVDNKSGGVDKSVIGMIVAGMVVVVAGITIKKNWSSIRNKFRSSPRPANDRNGTSANGVSPEEVPLQEKSPV